MGLGSNTALRQLLKSLCSCNSIWNYAVLWKLRLGTPMFLTWEDGYFNHPKPRELVETISDDVYCKEASSILFSPQFETNTSRGISEEYPIGLLVAEMSNLQYIFGEGVVGKVAAIRDHYWISFNHIFTDEVNLIPECPEEWLFQFASGIKTILLVPVLPHGVLQLGSLEEVAEDCNMLAYFKSRFNCLFSVEENSALHVLLSSPLTSNSMVGLNLPSTSGFTSLKTEDLDQSIASNIVELNNDNLASASYSLQKLTVQDATMPMGGSPTEALISVTDNKADVPLTEVSSSSVSTNARQLEMVESKLSSLMEELHAYSEELQGLFNCNDYNMGVLRESSTEVINFYHAGYLAGEPCGDKYATDMDNKIVSSFLRFPKDCELHKALEPAFGNQTNGKPWDSSFMVQNTCSTLSLPPSKDPSERTEPPWLARGGDGGYLLEAVITNACSDSDLYTSNKSSSVKSSTSFSGHINTPLKLQKQHNASSLFMDDFMPWSHHKSECITEEKIEDSTSDSLRTMMSTVFSTEQKERESDSKELKGQKMLNSTKRRAKLGGNQRPRPRDRQLIQDRVKELRELVPNGEKCSIDGLLDRTIKHMKYLRSITDQAEKLRQCVRQEVAGCKNWRSSETKENFQNGSSWAFEFGSDFHVCPIAVEDLAHPGHMLIEILCNEQGLFLEIAQVIRSLELTILKGALDIRSNNTWARFIVEACKGFHRLDIFWPLMQLLQRKRKPLTSKI